MNIEIGFVWSIVLTFLIPFCSIKDNIKTDILLYGTFFGSLVHQRSWSLILAIPMVLQCSFCRIRHRICRNFSNNDWTLRYPLGIFKRFSNRNCVTTHFAKSIGKEGKRGVTSTDTTHSSGFTVVPVYERSCNYWCKLLFFGLGKSVKSKAIKITCILVTQSVT